MQKRVIRQIEFQSPEQIIKELDILKNNLIKKFEILVAKKKSLYSNVDISTPMSAEEKALDKAIADIASEMNAIVKQKRAIRR